MARNLFFSATILAIVFGASILPQAAYSQGAQIGEVASIRKDAARSGKPLRLGDPVFANDVITTGADSSVRITFADRTNLALGPSSRATLDRFVFSGEQALTITATRGAFRFTSGGMNKTAYRVNTPTSTMGVRGTIVEVHVNSRGARYTVLQP
jgi:outer membrane immunogenic protein